MEFLLFIDNEKKIQDRLAFFSTVRCNSHPKYQAEQVCIDPSCMEKLACFLCELCIQKHNPNHTSKNLLIPLDIFFSTKLLDKVLKEQEELSNKKIHSNFDNLSDIIDNLFDEFIDSIIKSLNKHRAILKNDLLQKFEIKIFPSEKKIVKDFQEILIKNFLNNNISNINEIIKDYALSFDKLSELRCTQIKLENRLSLIAENAITNMKKISNRLKNDTITIFNNTFEMMMPSLTDPDYWLVLSERSSIIDSGQNGEIQNLMKWIQRQELKTCKLNLIYRGSRDGLTSDSFHKKCDSNTPTISIILSNYGNIFGGYTEANWIDDGLIYSSKKDEKAFLFSLSKQEKYPCKDTSTAIYGYKNCLLTYGRGYDINIVNDCYIQESTSNFPSSYSCSLFPQQSKISNAYLAGASKFKVIDIEVYHVQWD